MIMNLNNMTYLSIYLLFLLVLFVVLFAVNELQALFLIYPSLGGISTLFQWWDSPRLPNTLRISTPCYIAM